MQHPEAAATDPMEGPSGRRMSVAEFKRNFLDLEPEELQEARECVRAKRQKLCLEHENMIAEARRKAKEEGKEFSQEKEEKIRSFLKMQEEEMDQQEEGMVMREALRIRSERENAKLQEALAEPLEEGEIPSEAPKTAFEAMRMQAEWNESPEGQAAERRMMMSYELNRKEQQWQQGVELAMAILMPMKVDTPSEFTLLPTSATVEHFRKAVAAFMKQEAVVIPYTFTQHKSFQTVVARLLLHFVVKEAGIGDPNSNPSALTLWDHNSLQRPHCFHGKLMLNKEQLIEMDVNSERGQAAIKDQPDKAKIVTNKWGRQIVQIKNEDAMCCFEDANMSGNNYSAKSCGMSFTEGSKAVTAVNQAAAFMLAYYPQMGERAQKFLPLPIKCECNYEGTLPILGRQLPKVTPYALNVSQSMGDNVSDPKLLASLNFPAVLVFQCCNPVYSKSKATVGKNCDFKISTVDVVAAMKVAKDMWAKLVRKPAPMSLPEFKWESRYQFHNAILPQIPEDGDKTLF